MSLVDAPSNDSYLGCTGTMIGGGWCVTVVVVVAVLVVVEWVARTTPGLKRQWILHEFSPRTLKKLRRRLHWHHD